MARGGRWAAPGTGGGASTGGWCEAGGQHSGPGGGQPPRRCRHHRRRRHRHWQTLAARRRPAAVCRRSQKPPVWRPGLPRRWARLSPPTSRGWRGGAWPGWPCRGSRATTSSCWARACGTWCRSRSGRRRTTAPAPGCSSTGSVCPTSAPRRTSRSRASCTWWRRPTARGRPWQCTACWGTAARAPCWPATS